MKYPWAVIGAKVVYIGPPVVHQTNPIFSIARPSPYKPHPMIYTISDVVTHPMWEDDVVGLLFVELPMTWPGFASLFKPVKDVDTEMFNELLNDIPDDIKHERIDQLAKELDHASH